MFEGISNYSTTNMSGRAGGNVLGFALSYFDEIKSVRSILNEIAKLYPGSNFVLFCEKEDVEQSSLISMPHLLIDFISSPDIAGKLIHGVLRADGKRVPFYSCGAEEALQVAKGYMDRVRYLISLPTISHWVILHPDCQVRGRINLEKCLPVDGPNTNRMHPFVIEKISQVRGTKPFNPRFGPCVGVFSRDALSGLVDAFDRYQQVLIDCLAVDTNLASDDYLWAFLSELAGVVHGDSGIVTEVEVNLFWKINKSPIVHQFRRNFEDTELKRRLSRRGTPQNTYQVLVAILKSPFLTTYDTAYQLVRELYRLVRPVLKHLACKVLPDPVLAALRRIVYGSGVR